MCEEMAVEKCDAQGKLKGEYKRKRKEKDVR